MYPGSANHREAAARARVSACTSPFCTLYGSPTTAGARLSNAQLPLTPTLSLGERENCRTRTSSSHLPSPMGRGRIVKDLAVARTVIHEADEQIPGGDRDWT